MEENSCVMMIKNSKYLKNKSIEILLNLCILIKNYQLKEIYIHISELLNDELYHLLSAIKYKYKDIEVVGYIEKAQTQFMDLITQNYRCDKTIIYENKSQFMSHNFFIVIKKNKVDIISNS